jgi:hypothetical protein
MHAFSGTTEMPTIHDIDRVFERKRQDKIKLEEEYKVSETKVQQMQQETSLNEKGLAEVLLRKNKVELDQMEIGTCG